MKLSHRGGMKPHLLALTALAGLALAPAAKADIWTYDVQTSGGVLGGLHVKFDLSSFMQDVVDQTTFDVATSSDGTVTRFDLSGGSAACSNGFNGESSGPCWLYGTARGSLAAQISPSFNGAGTFSDTVGGNTTTIIITDTPSSVPEPAAWSLLSTALVGAGLLARKRRATHHDPPPALLND